MLDIIVSILVAPTSKVLSRYTLKRSPNFKRLAFYDANYNLYYYESFIEMETVIW